MNEKTIIPYTAKDPRYQRVYYLTRRRGMPLKDAVKLIDEDTTIPAGERSANVGHGDRPENASIPDRDPEGTFGMILDILTLLHCDFKEIHADLRMIAIELKLIREVRLCR